MKRLTLISMFILLSQFGFPSPSTASFHLIKIREVFPGTAGDPNAQYVMLQLYSAGQNLVAGKVVTAYDVAGTLVGTFTFPSDVANGANQAYILLATGEAQTLFTISADLLITPDLIGSGGRVCWEDLDCVSWGPFAGSSLTPSPSGTPIGGSEGLQAGHAFRRDISHGNTSTLQAGDDSDDSFADFDCVATAEPINNAGVSAATPYTDATPCAVCGNATKEFGEQCDDTDDSACAGGCQANCLCPAHDSVVLPVKPLKIKLPAPAPASVTKNMKVRVVNADVSEGGSDTVQLTASSDCPPGVTIGTPNFGSGDTIVLPAGGKAAASVAITVTDTAFTTFNSKAAKRCTLTFTSTTTATNPPGGGGTVAVVSNGDPIASNNTMSVELNILDANDTPTASPPHESFTVSAKPLKVKISSDSLDKTKKIKPAVGNADIAPAADADDAISVVVDASGCPGPPVVTLDMDSDTVGNQSIKLVDGGKTGKGTLLLSVAAADVHTPNSKSPHRCTATITATGPSDPDPDTTNNTTSLVIDILDLNDY